MLKARKLDAKKACKEHQKALRAVQKRKAKLLKKTKALSVRDLETILAARQAAP